MNLIKTANGKYVTVRQSMINFGTFERICYIEDLTLLYMFSEENNFGYTAQYQCYLCKAANAGTYVNLSSWHEQVWLPRAWTTLHTHCVANVYEVLPVSTVKCLCSEGREWGREATPTSISIFDCYDMDLLNWIW